MGDDLQPIEARRLQRACPLHGTILEGDILLSDIGIHDRTCLIIDSDIGNGGTRAQHLNDELSFLTSFVIPVAVVGGDYDGDVVASNLGRSIGICNPDEQGQEKEERERVFHFIGVIGIIGVIGVIGVIRIIGVIGVIGVIRIIGVIGVIGIIGVIRKTISLFSPYGRPRCE